MCTKHGVDIVFTFSALFLTCNLVMQFYWRCWHFDQYRIDIFLHHVPSFLFTMSIFFDIAMMIDIDTVSCLHRTPRSCYIVDIVYIAMLTNTESTWCLYRMPSFVFKSPTSSQWWSTSSRYRVNIVHFFCLRCQR